MPTTDQQRVLGIIITKDLYGKTNREKMKNGQQSNEVYYPQFQVQNQRTDPPIIQIPSPQTHLEHSLQFCSPHLRRDIDKIEKIQRRATKTIPDIRNHSYHQRIQDPDLISLVQRRLRGQLIKVFKYMNNLLLPVQDGSSILTLMTEQETMEPNLL